MLPKKSSSSGAREGSDQSKPAAPFFFAAPVDQREPFNRGIPLHFDPFEYGLCVFQWNELEMAPRVTSQAKRLGHGVSEGISQSKPARAFFFTAAIEGSKPKITESSSISLHWKVER